MGGFESLIVWREAASLAANVVAPAERMRGIGSHRSAEQIIDAADSIQANIAEGYGRLRVALLSGRMAEEVALALISQTRRVSYLIRRYASWVERQLGEDI